MTNETTEATEIKAIESNPSIAFTTDLDLPIEVRQGIMERAEALKTQHKLRKIFIVLVEGDGDDDKPLYVAYFRRPGLMHFSQYMNFVQKDLVQANRMLAQNVFLAGDKELVDDEDLFLYGTMSQLNNIINSRNTDMVKA